MTGDKRDMGRALARAVAVRFLGLLALWLAIGGIVPADLPVGLLSASAACWVSLVLVPPRARAFRQGPAVRLGSRLLWQSLVAGTDVASRALAPRLRIDPGFIRYRPRLPRGPARAAFATLISLVPGTLPTRAGPDGILVIHCLDVGEPVAAGLEREEALVSRVLDGSVRDG